MTKEIYWTLNNNDRGSQPRQRESNSKA